MTNNKPALNYTSVSSHIDKTGNGWGISSRQYSMVNIVQSGEILRNKSTEYIRPVGTYDLCRSDEIPNQLELRYSLTAVEWISS